MLYLGSKSYRHTKMNIILQWLTSSKLHKNTRTTTTTTTTGYRPIREHESSRFRKLLCN